MSEEKSQIQSQEERQTDTKKLGQKQKAILSFLKERGGSAWQQDIIDKFAWSAGYQYYVLQRLKTLQQRGLIVIKSELNPETGRMKKRVYLIQ